MLADTTVTAEDRPSWSRVASLAKSLPRTCSYETRHRRQNANGVDMNHACIPCPWGSSEPSGASQTTRGRYFCLVAVTARLPSSSSTSQWSGRRSSVTGSAGHGRSEDT